MTTPRNTRDASVRRVSRIRRVLVGLAAAGTLGVAVAVGAGGGGVPSAGPPAATTSGVGSPAVHLSSGNGTASHATTSGSTLSQPAGGTAGSPAGAVRLASGSGAAPHASTEGS